MCHLNRYSKNLLGSSLSPLLCPKIVMFLPDTCLNTQRLGSELVSCNIEGNQEKTSNITPPTNKHSKYNTSLSTICRNRVSKEKAWQISGGRRDIDCSLNSIHTSLQYYLLSRKQRISSFFVHDGQRHQRRPC